LTQTFHPPLPSIYRGQKVRNLASFFDPSRLRSSAIRNGTAYRNINLILETLMNSLCLPQIWCSSVPSSEN